MCNIGSQNGTFSVWPVAHAPKIAGGNTLCLFQTSDEDCSLVSLSTASRSSTVTDKHDIISSTVALGIPFLSASLHTLSTGSLGAEVYDEVGKSFFLS